MKHFTIASIILFLFSVAMFYLSDTGYLYAWGVFGIFTVILVLATLGLIVIVGIEIVGRLLSTDISLGRWIVTLLTVMVLSGAIMIVEGALTEVNKHTPETSEHASIEEVELNGTTQYYTLRGEDLDNPIILFLAGGPGGSQVQKTRVFLADLEADYTIVNWEQPGSGMSYGAYDTEDITVERYIEDGLALTEHLMETYDKDHIYLLGESWGSYLAIELATRQPDYYGAIFTAGQMVDFVETEEFCYNMAMEIAENTGDTQQVEALESLGEPPYYGPGISTDMATYLMYLHQQMQRDGNINHVDFETWDELFSVEYSILDSINFMRALYFTFAQVYQQLYDTDLRETHTNLNVPIYILHGRHDINAPLYLAEDYYEQIDAPDKELYIFEHSGHNPWVNEPEAFMQVLRTKIDAIEQQ